MVAASAEPEPEPFACQYALAGDACRTRRIAQSPSPTQRIGLCRTVVVVGRFFMVVDLARAPAE
jgi:hypothetical protein